MSITAMKQALEALESCTPADTSTGHVVWPSYDEQAVAQAITTLRTAIAEAEKQEPVAWLYRDAWGTLKLSQIMPPPTGAFPVYTTPPSAQRQWVGLTDDEIKEIIGPWGDTPIKGYTRKLFDQIEAKLKEQNHG